MHTALVRPSRALAASALLAATLLGRAPLAAQAAVSHTAHTTTAAPGPRERLGAIAFPTSAAPAARAEFVRGVLYLHNFHYPQAVQAFRRARALDRRDVMSAAFEALAHTHPVWNEQDTTAARAALRSLAPTREARAALARTPRERLWLEAAESLYDGDAPKATRDTAFHRAMTRLRADDPRDPEAATFHALSMLGLNQGERERVAYAAAEALADSVLRAHPRHPGALHVKIHAVDDPANAARGLDAARAYGAVAPDAAHAQHMTSHIYLARGMWEEAVAANRRAVALTPGSFGHYAHWLAYALVQQGRVREARAYVDSTLAAHRTPNAHLVLVPTTWVIDAEAWDSPLARARLDTLRFPGMAMPALADFLVAYSAARRAARPVDVTPGSRAEDRRLVDSLLASMAARRTAAESNPRVRRSALGESLVMEQVVRAELLNGAGRADSAVALLRAAAERYEALPFEFGPPAVPKPPRERVAEILLFAGRPAEALAELDLAERTAPGRTLARVRRARALDALGRRAEARREYATLDSLWRRADATFPFATEARWGAGRAPAGASDTPVVADTVTFASGGLSLRGERWRPAVAGRHPAIVLLHGSGYCWRPWESEPLGRRFAARGYVTFFPCRRGQGLSAGQGEAVLDQLRREGLTARDSAFAARSTHLLETTQLDDVRAAIAALRTWTAVDPARVAVGGSSYGGILTLLAAADDSTLRGAVAFAPAAMNWGFNAPVRDRLAAAGRRTRVPTLVLQAENDWNVRPTAELPAEIRAGGGEATGKVYPAVGQNTNEGHGLMVTVPSLWERDVLAFLDRHARPVARPPAAGRR